MPDKRASAGSSRDHGASLASPLPVGEAPSIASLVQQAERFGFIAEVAPVQLREEALPPPGRETWSRRGPVIEALVSSFFLEPHT